MVDLIRFCEVWKISVQVRKGIEVFNFDSIFGVISARLSNATPISAYVYCDINVELIESMCSISFGNSECLMLGRNICVFCISNSISRASLLDVI